jgi:hypothetical protein
LQIADLRLQIEPSLLDEGNADSYNPDKV